MIMFRGWGGDAVYCRSRGLLWLFLLLLFLLILSRHPTAACLIVKVGC